MNAPLVPVSWGELIDKITILEIKHARITRTDARAHVAAELAALQAVYDPIRTAMIADLKERLSKVNTELWEIEDDIREHEREKRFDADFIALARAVYRTNDKRAVLKREINQLLSSDLVEEKNYAAY